VRETFESAMVFGEHVLKGLGYDPAEIAETLADVRQRDEDRLGLQLIGGITAGRSLMRNNQATPEPAPLTRPKHAARALNPEATKAVEQGD
jgi:glutathione-regulated potassium-efflux system protein KefB